MQIKCKECGNTETFIEKQEKEDLFHEYLLEKGKLVLFNEDLGNSYRSSWFCGQCDTPLSERQSAGLTKYAKD